MAKALITRIRKIGNYRVFQAWNDENRANEFGRVNLIYGTNGSGKSTLANLFHSCATATPEAAKSNVELSVSIDGVGTTITQSSAGFWTRVKVFNADYVRENLRFDDSHGPRSDSLLTLGKSNVDAERELEDAERRRAEIEPLAAEARAEVKSADGELQQRMTEIAGHIVDDLRSSPVATYRGTNVYTRRNVRNLLEGDRIVFESASTDIAADVKTATSDAPPAYTTLARPKLPDVDALLEASLELLSTDVTSRPLAELTADTARAVWVQEGLPLHEHEQNCLFCGNSLSAGRRADLAAHFDRSLTELQQRIDEQLEVLRNAHADASKMAESIPRDSDLYPDLAGMLRVARDDARAQVDRFQKAISELTDALGAKRANPFKSTSYVAANLEIPTLDKVAAVVAAHEKRRSEHAAEAASAARRVELARVKSLADEFDRRAKRLRESTERADELEAELRELSSRIIALSNLEADPVPQAAELTASVSRLLGRSDLAFTPSEDGKQYRIERAGAPATHLSEGERTAIGLLHFLASIREGVIAGDEPIVVIDDPVSSMDDGILFGISSFLWSSLVENTYVSQVLLLTHNFELLGYPTRGRKKAR